MPVRSPSAVLFDIDGTLLAGASPAHVSALAAGVADVCGRPPRWDVTDSGDGLDVLVGGAPIGGLTDLGVVDRLLATVDTVAGQVDLGRLYATAVGWLRRHRPTFQPTPGAAVLLDRLAAGKIPVALVTGNHPALARHKLAAAGLDGPFRFDPSGGFGFDERDRAVLAGRALAQLDRPPGPDVWLVGDTPADMAAARACGCTAVAVGAHAGGQAHVAVGRLDQLTIGRRPDLHGPDVGP